MATNEPLHASTASSLPVDHVAPDALLGVPRQQSNASRWQGGEWDGFVEALAQKNIAIQQQDFVTGIYITDAGGLAHGLPHGVVVARNAQQIAVLMQTAQQFAVPVTVRGGALTTEGESVAFGGVLLDMTGMSRVLEIDVQALTVRTEAGIFWHHLAEELRRDDLDYLSAPLNLTSSVGGTLGVGGIDVNSSKHGCSADQALALQVVTPTGEIIECSDEKNSALFERVILGYGQFGIITEALLKIRPYTPLRMHYFYYNSLRPCVEDLLMLDRSESCDYTGILTMMDSAITLLVAFDSVERETAFMSEMKGELRGYGELMFALRLVSWDEIERHVSWSVVLMYGGAIAVGSALSVSGAGAWLATQLFPAGLAGVALIVVLTIATLLLTEGVSNAAAVAILLPIAIPVGVAAGIDPLTIALAVGIVAGFAFMLPMGTPPNAMIYGTGFVQRLAMLRFGGLLSLSALLLFVLISQFWWPVIGFGVGS